MVVKQEDKLEMIFKHFRGGQEQQWWGVLRGLPVSQHKEIRQPELGASGPSLSSVGSVLRRALTFYLT